MDAMTFANKQLAQATKKIEKLTLSAEKNLMHIALIINDVNERELYKDDFDSVCAYGEKVFGYKKTVVYNMLKIARLYLVSEDKDVHSIFSGVSDKDFTFNQLARMLPLSKEQACDMVDNYEITSDMTLQEINKKVKEALKADQPETEAEAEAEAETEVETEIPELDSQFITIYLALDRIKSLVDADRVTVIDTIYKSIQNFEMTIK